MASPLTSSTLRRANLSPTLSKSTQTRAASLLSRPHRPYTFTQLTILSDGSSFVSRTTSPAPVYRSLKDTLNHQMWQPSMSSLRNIEQDEAGRLRAFREKFGRGWDIDGAEEEGNAELNAGEEQVEKSASLENDSLMDLISEAVNAEELKQMGSGPARKPKKK